MIIKELNYDRSMDFYAIDLLFSSIFVTILQIFSSKVTLIRDQVWINIYGP